MFRLAGLSLWRLLLIVFGFWMIVLLFVSMELSSNFSSKPDKERLSLNRIEMAEKTVSELKSRNIELQRLLSSIIRSNNSNLSSLASSLKPQSYDKTADVLHTDLFVNPNAVSFENVDLFLQMSEKYKDLYNQVLELWFFLRNNKFNNDDALKSIVKDRFRHIFSYAERFRDVLEPSKKQYAQNLSTIIYQRIYHLQNPADCASAKFALCDLGKGCGFGCQIHHVAYCLMVGYALERTVHLNGKPWSYTMEGFNSIFQPIGNTDSCLSVINENSAVDWDGGLEQSDIQVLKIPIVDSIRVKPEFMPMAIPEDLAPQIKAFHTQPFIWWVGHFLRYILRPLPETCKSILTDIENRFGVKMSEFSSLKPLVTIQVRRTDKLLSEAQFHGVGEYMNWVAEYYDQLDYKLDKKVVRSVYIATDEPTVLDDARKEFPTYKFYNDPTIAETAALNTRYSDSSLHGILIDTLWMAQSDFVVCTFSSQVCRLGFALMQTLHGDAGDRFRSLDDVYYYGGQLDHLFEAVLPHAPANKNEIEMKVGDQVHIAGNHWDGYSKGTNKRTNRHGLFPSYKARDVIYVAKMPTYSTLTYQKEYRLPDDSCLVV